MSEKIKKILKIVLKVGVVILLMAISFGGGVFVGYDRVPAIEKVSGLSGKEDGKPQDVDFNLFWDVWHDVETSFVDKSKMDKKAMVYGAIAGMVKSLKDPYTVFMAPEEAKKFKDDVSGSFEGIGAEIGIRKDVLTIVSPLKDSPAEKAGLRAGDKILKINDTLTADLTVDEAVTLIRGPKGTEVTLYITRDGFESAKEIKIVRGVIKIPTVKFEMKEGNIAYIALYYFYGNSSMELRGALRDALLSGAQGLVLDLRNNPGGLLDMSIDIASIFLPEGKVVVSEDYGNGEKSEHKSYGPAVLKDFPMVVLVNEGSASASEILAGALRDVRGVKLIGQKTFGKGSVQRMEDLEEGASLKVTIAKWFTPNGYSISDGGLQPDVEVVITDEDIEKNKDPQLEKALETIKSLK